MQTINIRNNPNLFISRETAFKFLHGTLSLVDLRLPRIYVLNFEPPIISECDLIWI